MRHFFKRILRFLLGPSRNEFTCAAEPRTEAQVLRQKIEKWERQADEYESMGLTELARRSRESLRWYHRKFKALEDPSIRRVA